ncbi:MAG TPA: MmcQ/YjbR family DNA-binding protein [Terriglobia bacterium]|nr:MmcQ/YjbR family DNA-binding protein [Terriglobia bacterium]
MTSADFRRLALSLPEAVESAHMGHPDFRVGGKIFATLGFPEHGWGMVKLTPEQQDLFVQAEPAVFEPFQGAWGRRGATKVHLKPARKPSLRHALSVAWRNTAPKRLVAQLEKGGLM